MNLGRLSQCSLNLWQETEFSLEKLENGRGENENLVREADLIRCQILQLAVLEAESSKGLGYSIL